ncbi:MAG: protein kinase domain-containing protein, partial [Acidimicrobiales bacterium]
MKAGDSLNRYRLLGDFTTAGGGQSKWTFARRGAKDYFLKEFLAPTYPGGEAPGSPEVKARKRARCATFEAHHRSIMDALEPLSSAGGNLVVTADFFRHGAKYYKVTEKVDVASITPEAIAKLPLSERILVMLTATHSLNILHRVNLVHGDLKPANVLIKQMSPGRFTTKLIDFDNCFFAGEPAPPEELVGDPVYYSPELMAYVLLGDGGAALGPKSDIFALGVVFAQYVTGELPEFQPARLSFPPLRYAADIVRSGGRLRLRPAGLPRYVEGLIHLMLAADPARRPSGDEVFRALKRMQSMAGPAVGGGKGGGDDEELAVTRARGPRLRGTLAARTAAAPGGP